MLSSRYCLPVTHCDSNSIEMHTQKKKEIVMVTIVRWVSLRSLISLKILQKKIITFSINVHSKESSFNDTVKLNLTSSRGEGLGPNHWVLDNALGN